MGWTARHVKALMIGFAVLGLVLGVGWLQGTYAAKEESGPLTPEKVFPASSKCKKCHIRAFEDYEESIVARAI
ncbi:MAG: hypothetical protein Q7R68_05120, partial [Nitrospirales bacterium]|nr:hypothetical protein [Nitrospirales bacterium]